MDLTKYALESETDEHWAVKGPRGAFRIAKKGLGKKMHDQIAQHFADGGQVQPDPAAVLLPSGTVQDVPADLRGSVYDPATLPGATTLEPLNPAPLEPLPVSLAAPPPVQTTSVLAGPSREEQLGRVVTDLANARAAGLLPASEPALPASATAPAPVPAVAPAQARPAPASGMGGATQAAISRSYAESEAATQAQVDVVKREAASTLAVQQENEAKRQAAVQEWQQKTAEWQKRGDTLRDSIINQKINPNQYWESRGTGGKISAAIGIVLGGLGSGLSGGPNVALKVINDAVDRDIDAQKSNLDNKRSLLAYHMQEGHSIQAAQQLARADLLDASAAKLQMTATRYAGDKAQANAGGAIAELHRTAAVTRQAVAAQNLDMQLKGLQVDATRQAMAAAQGVGAGDAQTMLARLPKEDRERSVVAPDGRIYMMARKEDAAKVQEQVRGYREVTAGLNDMRELRRKHGRSWAPFTAEKASGRNMRDQMIGSLRLAILGPGAITDAERELMKEIIPLPGEVYMTDAAFEAKLREVQQKASDAMWSGLTGSGADLPRPRIPERKG